MGMSASQARFLSITARMNDVEFKSQNISNTKIRLADESEQVSKKYTEALNKQKFSYTDWSSGTAQKIDLNSANLKNALADKFKLVDAQGRQVVYTEAETKLPNGQTDPTKVYISKVINFPNLNINENGTFKTLQSFITNPDGTYA